MRPMSAITMAAALLASVASAGAQAIDWSKVDEAFGRKATVSDNVHRYGFPRTDLTVTVEAGMRFSHLPKRKTPSHEFGNFLSYLYCCTLFFLSNAHTKGQSLFTSVEHDIQFTPSAAHCALSWFTARRAS